MRKFFAILTAAAGVLATTAALAGSTGNMQFLVGQRYLDGTVWAPVDRPQMFGFQIDFGPSESPVHVALGAAIATDSSSRPSTYFNKTNIEASFSEMSAGFLWLPVRRGFARPYLGGGVLTMSAGLDDDEGWIFGGETDRSFGYYANAGVYFKVGERFNIGIDGRAVRGTRFDIDQFRVEGDYEQVSLLIGFSWGGGPPTAARPVPDDEDEGEDEDGDEDEEEGD